MSAPLKPRRRKPLIAFLFILLLGSAYPLGLFVWMGTPLYFNHGLMPEQILTEEIPGRTGLARAENGEWQLVYNPCGADVEHVAVSDNMTGVFAVDSSVADATKRGAAGAGVDSAKPGGCGAPVYGTPLPARSSTGLGGHGEHFSG